MPKQSYEHLKGEYLKQQNLVRKRRKHLKYHNTRENRIKLRAAALKEYKMYCALRDHPDAPDVPDIILFPYKGENYTPQFTGVKDKQLKLTPTRRR